MINGVSDQSFNSGDIIDVLSGVTATDDQDGNITSDIIVGGDIVDENTPGTYDVTYDVDDSAGNSAVTENAIFTVKSAPNLLDSIVETTAASS